MECKRTNCQICKMHDRHVAAMGNPDINETRKYAESLLGDLCSAQEDLGVALARYEEAANILKSLGYTKQRGIFGWIDQNGKEIEV